jgi:O-antigen biosynthesis protein
MPFINNAKHALEILRADGSQGLTRSFKRKLVRALDEGGIWYRYGEEATMQVAYFDFTPEDVIASQKILAQNSGKIEIKSITWFIPDFFHAYYGGIYTILRFADYFSAHLGIENRFALVGGMDLDQAKTKIAQAFPNLAGVSITRVNSDELARGLEPSDAAIATLWNTAYYVLKYNATRRKFLFMQDHESLFYPAGSTSAQVDAACRFGFYGLVNTPSLKGIYQQEYMGQAEYFTPCVDAQVFHLSEHPKHGLETPYQVFFYARPGNPRNGFELGIAAMRKLKQALGDKVRIVSAGANWFPSDYHLNGVIENLGLLSYAETGALYRECDAGLVMMFTRHPSYLPFEMMASGCLVVTNCNPATTWLLKDEVNCLLSEVSASCLASRLQEGLVNEAQRTQIVRTASAEVETNYRLWDVQIEKIFRYMCQPD